MALPDFLNNLFRGKKPVPTLEEATPLDLFLYGGEPIDPGSSYAASWSYEKATQELVVTYYDGIVWAYTIDDKRAESFFFAGSHGTWMWDNVRVRGTKHDHQVPARQRS